MEDNLRRLQMTQLDILKCIHSVCLDHGIHYSLYAGTLLGAVRHHGFIPWDDDLDICMERREYDRFLQAWDQTRPKGFLLQNKENSPAFDQSFTKIRKEHTTFLQPKDLPNEYHTGIFIDIFPIDRMPESKPALLLFAWDCLRYQLYSREFVPPKGNIIQKMVSSVLLAAVPPEKRAARRKALLKRIIKYNSGKGNAVAIETMNTICVPLPENLLDEYVRLPFEDGEYMCFKNWDGYLKAKYGDYMTLPPESERTWKHHPILIDFEHDYEEFQQTGTDHFP